MLKAEKTYDVLVAGGGNAGLCAAISAAEAGARVLLLEHAPGPFRGGNSRHTRNMRTMHIAPTPVLTDAYTEEEYWQDLVQVTGGRTNEQLARMTIRGTGEAVPWMEVHGVVFQPSLTGTINLSRTNAFYLGGGKALVNAYYRAAQRLGVDVAYDVEVTHLVLDDAAVSEVHVKCNGSEVAIRPRAIVVASGGYQANLEWLEQHWGEAAKNFRIRGTPYARGVLLRDLLDQGVAPVGDPAQCHAVAIDARSPRFDGGIVTRLDSVPFGIVVNQSGHRFYDEGEDAWPKRYAIWGRLVAEQPGQIAYSIVDSTAESLFMPSVFPAIKANTVDELARELKIPADVLSSTVNEFNAAVRPGEFDAQALDGCRTEGLDPAKTNWAKRIEKPPFIAYPLRPGITFTYLGVKVDEHAQVLLAGGEPVRNVFAAGEIMAGNLLGQGYLAGFGMAIGTVFGRIAGKEAASYARR